MSQTTPPRLQPPVTPEQARAALQNMSEQLAPFRAAMQQLAENAQHTLTAMRPLIEYARAHGPDPELELGSCHCLCVARHGDRMDVCTGHAIRGLTMTIHDVQVPMCRPCHEVETVPRPGPREPLPATQAPTDTCTCHCWANHPDESGVCEAASHPGAVIDGKPACQGCRDAAQEGVTP